MTHVNFNFQYSLIELVTSRGTREALRNLHAEKGRRTRAGRRAGSNGIVGISSGVSYERQEQVLHFLLLLFYSTTRVAEQV